MLTLEYLKSQLDYNKDDGNFRWKVKRHKVNIGDIAGSYRGLGYWSIRLDYDRYYAHRLAWFYMTGRWPKDEIDHINNIKDDNRWCNLREANREENSYNCSLRSHNKSGYKGVYKTTGGLFCAQIVLNKNKINIGFYNSPEEASIAYNNFAKRAHGDFVHSSMLL